jgi:predicted ATP-grasp superfamily ATP-dependent carboligase
VELRTAVERLAGAGLDGEVFDFVPGADDQIWSHNLWIGACGEPGPGVTVRKIRQSPATFGVARVARVVDELPGLRDATVAVARQLDLRGAVNAEFKRDPRDGRLRFIEINGRSVIYNALLRRAGHDVAALGWAEHVERQPVKQQPSAWRGTWINLHADLLNGLLRRDEGLGVRAFGTPYRAPLIEAVWSRQDPAPFAAQWGRTLRLAASGLNPLRAVRERRLHET